MNQFNSTLTYSKNRRKIDHVYESRIARRAYGIVETLVHQGSIPRRG
jgi:hypothetical protein